MKVNTVDQSEIAHFAKDSSHWWDPEGPFKPLHWMTPARMEYIRERIIGHFGYTDERRPFSGLRVLDIGCGGGLACEPVARLGGHVTGIDADENAISVAQNHAKQSGLEINYIHGAAEHLVDDNQTYDVVLALEVIEHVAYPEKFISLCSNLVRPGGLLIVSTLNRTWKSYGLGIVAAEYVLGWAPRGTHDWKKFIKPSELARMVRNSQMQVTDICGVIYRPLQREFMLAKDDVDINYFLTAQSAI